MARTEARIFSRVWSDHDQADFRALDVGAQWLYWALLSQPELSMCGVLTVATERWSRLAGDANPKKVAAWLRALVDGRFVVHDPSSAEVWIRSFIRQDGVLRTPNFIVAMARAFDAIHSEAIRAGIVEQIADEFPEGFQQGLQERFPKGFPKGLQERFPKGFLDAVHGACTHVRAGARPSTPSPRHPITTSPSDEGSAEGSVPEAPDPTPPDGGGSDEPRGWENSTWTPSERRRADMLVDRARFAFNGNGKRPPTAELRRLIAWALTALDATVVDETLGRCADANPRPRTIAYLAGAIASRAHELSIPISDWTPGDAA